MKVWVSFTCILAVAFGWEHHQLSYHGPQHIPVIYKGVPIETPEVQHAKQAHFAALYQASKHATYEDASNHYDDGEYKHHEHSHYDDGQYKHQEDSHNDDGHYTHQYESSYDDGQYKHQEESHYDDGHYQEQEQSLNHYNNYDQQALGHHDNTHQGFEYSLKHGQKYSNHHQIPAYQTTHTKPKIGHDGKPLDTPEVEIAKAKHFAAVHEALSRTSSHGAHYRKRRGIESYDYTPEIHYEAPALENEYHFGNQEDYHFGGQEVSTGADQHGYTVHQEHAEHYNHGYYTHEKPQIGHDGKPLDTPEVELAKQEHFAAHYQAKVRNTWAKQGILPYEGLVDTPEVEHAKAAHFAAYAEAAAKTRHHHY